MYKENQILVRFKLFNIFHFILLFMIFKVCIFIAIFGSILFILPSWSLPTPKKVNNNQFVLLKFKH